MVTGNLCELMAVFSPSSLSVVSMSRPGVLCRGLPYQADVEDVRQFFKSLDITDRNIEILVCSDGLGSGVCYVALQDEDEVKRAMLMDRNHIGSRYIDVMRAEDERVELCRTALANGATRNEVHRLSAGEPVRSLPEHMLVRDRSPIRPGPRTTNTRTRCCYFRGLPDGSLYKDVRLFFKGVLIPKNSIHLLRDSSNRFRGDGYIEFSTSEELKKALKYDGERMNSSAIRVDPCSEEEMLDMMTFTERRERSPPPSHGIYSQGYGGYGGYSGGGSRDGGYRESGYRESGYRDSGGYRESSYRSRESSGHGGYYSEPSYSESSGGWSSYGEERGRGGYRSTYSRSSHSSSYGHHTEERKPVEARSRVLDPPVRGYGEQRRYDSSSSMISYPQASSIPAERKVLRIHGIPETASAADVMAFFRDYGVQYEDVRLQCHDNGRPNGKGFVTFPNERLAQTAYRNLNRQYLRGSSVELFLV